jgi:hypothetical protein
MSKKIGRNDPCPCGSGKKYKSCCLTKKDNVFSFPGSIPDDNKFAEYQAFVESRNPEDGPPPSFMEYLGHPNMATDALNKLQQSVGDREFASEKELYAFLNKSMETLNNSGNSYFLGLSPSHIRSILQADFSENTAIVELISDVTIEESDNIPVLKQCLYILEKFIESEKGIKATQAGNFPRVMVRDFYNRFLKAEEIIDMTPHKEDDVPGIQKLRFFLTENKLIKKEQNKFILTEKGRRFINDKPYNQYKIMFIYYIEKFYWLYGTRYSEVFEFIQDSVIFSLYILKQKADSFIMGEKISEIFLKAFPDFRKDVNAVMKYDILNVGYCHILLDAFAGYFGLVETQRVDKSDKKNFYLTDTWLYRTTPLFKKIFKWKV